MDSNNKSGIDKGPNLAHSNTVSIGGGELIQINKVGFKAKTNGVFLKRR